MAKKAWATSPNGAGASAIYKFDGASTWSYIRQVDAPTGNLNCVSIFFLDVDNDVWVLCGSWGTNSSRVYHWDGASWTTWDLPLFGRRIWGTATNNMYVAGWNNADGAKGEVYHWNGSSWTKVRQTSGQAQLQTIHGESADSIWAVAGERAGQGARDAQRWNGSAWSDDDAGTYSDGENSNFVMPGLYHANGQYYFATRTNITPMKLYTRTGVGTGVWTLHSAIPIVGSLGGGNQTWCKTIFVAGSKIFALRVQEDTLSAGEVWMKDGASAWAAVTPAGLRGAMSIHGDVDGNLWLAASDTSAQRTMWYRNVSTGLWTSYNLSGLTGGGNLMGDVWVEGEPPDVSSPEVFLRRPVRGASDVGLSSNVIVEIFDTGKGVDESSVVIKVDGVVAWTGDTQQSGFTVTKRALLGGFQYEINPDSNFKPSTQMAIEVYAEDLATTPNSVSRQLEFSTGAWV